MKNCYVVIFSILKALAAVMYPMRVERRAELPRGAAIVCANHSKYMDPVLIAIAFGIRAHFLHFMVKLEAMRIPVFGAILRSLGCFEADRSFGVNAARMSMKLLKSGEKVMIFPEGTRVSEDDSVAAKSGAVRLAMKLGVPIIPVFVPRKKVVFHRVRIVIGEPYTPAKEENPDYAALSGELMEKIKALAPAVRGTGAELTEICVRDEN